MLLSTVDGSTVDNSNNAYLLSAVDRSTEGNNINENVLHCTGSSSGVVVKLLACGARGPWFDSRPRR